jgi:drug/metabolite transporter (DMT)-like permease
MVSLSSVEVVPVELPRKTIDPRLVACLAAVYLIWSSTYLAMRIAVRELPPLLTPCLRFGGAGIVMFIVALRRGAKIPPARTWLRMAPVGVLLCLGGNGFVSLAERSVASGGAAVVAATMPLWVGVLGLFAGSRPTRREWGALLLGFIGVVVLAGGPSLAGDPMDIVWLILSPIAWGTGSILARTRKLADGPGASFMTPAMQILCGSAALGIAGLAHGERFDPDTSATAWGCLAYLMVFGSLIGFTSYSWLIRNARPVVATSYAYVNPVLATLLAAAVYGEPLGWTTLVANVLIVGAIALGMLKSRA